MSGSLAPTQAGFLTFVQTVMDIPPEVLPSTSPSIATAFSIAMAVVNADLALISPLMFQQAVYNLAGDVLLNIAQDQDERSFFEEYRARLGMNDFVPGMIGSASDTGTSQALANPDWVRTLTLGNLQNLKTPYGRAYLAIAQNYGTWFAMS